MSEFKRAITTTLEIVFMIQKNTIGWY